MSISAVFGVQLISQRTPLATVTNEGGLAKAVPWRFGGGGGLVIECSSRPNKKGTAHHRKTRPRKTQAWDIKRKPTVYAPLPPLPPDWTPLSDDSASSEAAQVALASSSSSPQESPII